MKFNLLKSQIDYLHIGKRLDLVIAKIFNQYSRSQIKTWICKGLLKLNGNVSLIPKKKIKKIETVELLVPINDNINIYQANKIQLDILYEDQDIIIINKQSGLVMHPGIKNNNNTLLNALLYYYPNMINIPRVGIVHRLDKDTTGLIVIAKNELSYSKLIKFLKNRRIIRIYDAIVTGMVKNKYGLINKPIIRHPIYRNKMTTNINGKSAITYYKVIKYFNGYTRLRVKLETGRTHQIRVHMKYINYPILGDQKYGCKFKFNKDYSLRINNILKKFNRQALHASTLIMYHPISNVKMIWHAPLPKDLILILNNLN